MKKISSGKVREIYEVDDDKLLLVVSDRISAFDYILPNLIPDKGKILNQISKFWFDYTKNVIPNHVISTDLKDFPEEFQTPEFEGRSMLVKKLKMIPVECIVRGYITGSGWKSYLNDGTVCGIKLPEGLQEAQKLPEPIFTPTTKAQEGHDENISFEERDNEEKYSHNALFTTDIYPTLVLLTLTIVPKGYSLPPDKILISPYS